MITPLKQTTFRETVMPTFMISMNFTDQGIRTIKDASKRTQAARELAKKLGIEIKHIYLTAGDADLVAFVEAPMGDNIAKFALALGSAGDLHTPPGGAWGGGGKKKLVSQL